MKMPKSKRMKNNASSAVKEKGMINMLINRGDDDTQESTKLVSKHTQLRDIYLKNTAVDVAGESLYGHNISLAEIQPNRFHFIVNKEILKILTKSNFPTRFPMRMNTESSLANVIVQEEGQELNPVPTASVSMTKVFQKFWNKVITKQDIPSGSALSHQITELESGYFPRQLNSIFDSPVSYVKKPYCHRVRYNGHGYQLLPTSNHFTKIASRSSASQQVQAIFSHYSDTANQYYLIPIELSSKLSRCLLRSNEICQSSQGCNKLLFSCQRQVDVEEARHPLCTIEYKSSIDGENLPCTSMSLVDNYQLNHSPNSNSQSQTLQKTFYNYPVLAHFLHRTDFWIDDFFARCWHFSRFFIDKLDLGARVNGSTNVLVRDSIFKYLLACSARICVAIKYWVLNPEGATYFRCWCGQKIYDAKQESKMLTRMVVGSAELFNFQQKLKEQDTFHNKHVEKKPTNHICACSAQFNDHKLWMTHIFSTKLSDLDKVCPVFMYTFSQQSHRENSFVCECAQRFSDYDFWSFWLHSCGCTVLRNLLKSNCACNPINKALRKNVSAKAFASVAVKPGSRVRSTKRLRLSRTYRSKRVRSTDNLGEKEQREDDEGSAAAAADDDDESGSSMAGDENQRSDKTHSSTKDNNEASDEKWLAGDNVDVPLKVSRQVNFNHFGRKRWRRC